MRRIEAIAVMTALAAATPVMAQGRGNGGIPPGHRPPAGMCRVWIDGVPPGRQPAPTDCAIAERYVPRNGRVIYGDNTTRNPRRIYTSNGQIGFPQRTEQSCVKRADRTGVIRTYCDNNTDRNNRDLGRRSDDRSNRDLRSRTEQRKHEHKKAKKHDRKGDQDHDWDRDHDRQRSDRDYDHDGDRHRN